MNIDPNDPQLTAYALGELSDEERAIIESALRESPPARGEVEQIRATVELVERALAAETLPRLTDTQRVGIEARFSDDAQTAAPARPPYARLRLVLWTVSGVAASIAALVLALPLLEWSTPNRPAPAPNAGNKATENNQLTNATNGASAGALANQNANPLPSIATTTYNDSDRTGSPASYPTMVDAKTSNSHDESNTFVNYDIDLNIAHTFDSNLTAELDGSALASKNLRPFNRLQKDSTIPAPGSIEEDYPFNRWRSMQDAIDSVDQLGNWTISVGSDAGWDAGSQDTWRLVLEKPAEYTDLPSSIYHPGSDDLSERYAYFPDNPYFWSDESPVSTFSIDVDTASYSNIRRMLTAGALPPAGAVRVEELVNYFDYDYVPPAADSEAPFAANIEIADCPWAPDHRLARIGLKGREMSFAQRPTCSLVFLVDVSGSMQTAERLPLIQQALRELAVALRPDDRIAIVTYAGQAGVALPSTSARDRAAIINAIDNLKADGSTNGGAGIQSAYEIAAANFIQGGANRVILATDGDFNVGVTDREELTKLVAQNAQSGVFLSVLSVGNDNVRDVTLEQIADKGNGHYAFVDDIYEARRVLLEKMSGTLVTIAKDVKIQVEFNPLQVAAYRLIGYENRMLETKDFDDDTKDAGEIGAGHEVTALYEIVPADWPVPVIQWITNPPTEDGRATLTPRLVGVCREHGWSFTSDEYANEPSAPDAIALADGRSPNAASARATPSTAGGSYRATAADGNAALAASPPSDEAPLAMTMAPQDTLALRLRYKAPDEDVSRKIEFIGRDGGERFADASADFRFQAAVAQFGMTLRESPFRGDWLLTDVAAFATAAGGEDAGGYRAEFVQLVEDAERLRAAAAARR